MKENVPYLTIPNKVSPIQISELAESDYDLYKEDSEKLHDFLYYKRRLKEIEFNKKAFFETKEYYTNLYKKSYNQTIDYDFKEEAYIEINRCLINFISSFKSFTEHCENKIKSMFGDNSEQLVEYKSVESGLYDKYFSYRLLKRLRDYAIHAHYPIENVSFDLITFDLSKTDCWYEVKVLFSRDKLLGNKTIKQKLGNDISLQEPSFDVSPFIFEVFDLVKIVLKQFIKIAQTDYIESAKRLITLSDTHRQDNLSLTKMQFIGYRIDYDSKILPISLAKELIMFLDQ